MAAPALNLDLSAIAVDQPEVPEPIANAFSVVQTTLNNLGNVHIAADAAIDRSKLVALDRCKAYNSGALLTATGSALVLPFDSEKIDTNAMHDLVTNNSRITIKKAGPYIVMGTINYVANNTGHRLVQLHKNGSALSAVRLPAALTGETSICAATVVDLIVGDYIEMVAEQSSGGNLNVNGGLVSGEPVYTHLEVIQIE